MSTNDTRAPTQPSDTKPRRSLMTLPPIPKASRIYYEEATLESRRGESPRKLWLLIRWATPKGRRVDHDSVIEFSGRTWHEVATALRRWIRRAKAKRVDWPTAWNQ